MGRHTRWRPTLIGIDCDGVVASDRELWQRMYARFPEHIPARYADLATFEWPRATAETHALCCELSADPQFVTQLSPMPGAARALRRLWSQGYRIQMITARPASVREATRQWLQAQGLSAYIDDIHCVTATAQKAPLARALGCAAFVEDNHATAELIAAAGLTSYLLDAPYNRHETVASLRMPGWRALVTHLTGTIPAREPIAQTLRHDAGPRERAVAALVHGVGSLVRSAQGAESDGVLAS